LKRIILKPGEEERILLGHPWVYGNEIDRVLEGRNRRNLFPANAPMLKAAARNIWAGR